jgi:TRAP-type C4-dicarboxylate transport system permease small subunit
MSRLWVELLCSVITLVFLGIIAKLGFDLAWLNRARTFGDSSISYAWVTVAVPVGCILLGVALAYNMVRAWQGRDKGKLVYTRTAADKDQPAILEL